MTFDPIVFFDVAKTASRIFVLGDSVFVFMKSGYIYLIYFHDAGFQWFCCCGLISNWRLNFWVWCFHFFKAEHVAGVQCIFLTPDSIFFFGVAPVTLRIFKL